MVLSRRVRNLARAFGEFADETGALLAIESIAELRKVTPVDTGWAAANWVASVNNANPRALKTPSTRAGRAAKIPTALARGEASIRKLSTYKTRQGPIFVVNGVPYIVFLNAGSSAQAPRNFVPQAIARARRRVNRKLRGKGGSRRVLGSARSPFSGRFTATPGGRS